MVVKNIKIETSLGEAEIRLERGDSWRTLVGKCNAVFCRTFKESRSGSDNLYEIIAQGIGEVEDWDQACYDLLQDGYAIRLLKNVSVSGAPFELKSRHLRDSLQRSAVYSGIQIGIVEEEKDQLFVSFAKNGKRWILRIRETPRFPMHPPSVLFVNPKSLVCDGQGWPEGTAIYPGAEGTGFICLGVTAEYLQKHPEQYNADRIWDTQGKF